jgi:hypothetical protein
MKGIGASHRKKIPICRQFVASGAVTTAILFSPEKRATLKIFSEDVF